MVYLGVRHGIHVCLLTLALFSATDLLRNHRPYRLICTDNGPRLMLLAFGGLFLATGLTQILQHKFHLASFDGPSRIVLAALVYLFLKTRPVMFGKALEIGLPGGLLAVFLIIQLYPETSNRWNGRFATSFVDPNTLGSQVTILTLLCLFSIGLFGTEKPWLLLLKSGGTLAGIYIAIHAQSRGGWMASMPLVLLWLLLKAGSDEPRNKALSFLPLTLTAVAVVAMFMWADNFPVISGRVTTAYDEAGNWLHGQDMDSATGLRLSMWQISLALAQSSPLIGYGETGFRELLSAHPLNVDSYQKAIDTLVIAGPHSDLLSKLLSMGLIGVLAYAATLAIPFRVFWLQRRNPSVSIRGSSHLGMYFILGLFVCGFANEMLSLKYLCSFFGLMIAGLASDIDKYER